MFRDTLVKFIHEADIGLRQLRVAGLLVEHFRRHVPVAFGEQDPGQCGALPGQTEPGRPQFRLSVMPRLAFEIATAGGVVDGRLLAAGVNGHQGEYPEAITWACVLIGPH
jgi:hypothetical protein